MDKRLIDSILSGGSGKSSLKKETFMPDITKAHTRKSSCKPQRRLTDGKKSLPLAEIHSFERPNSSIILAYREYYRALHNEMTKQKLSKTVAGKSEQNIRSNKEILQSGRFSNKFIPEGITDVDKNYFKIIQVRSKQKTRKLNRHQYLADINNCLRENIVTGYFYDEMFKIDEQYETEKNKLVKIRDHFSKLSGYFEMFLDDDHKESMDLIAASIRETSETEKRRDLLRKKQEKLGRIRNDIYGYEEIYEKTLSCASFILSITPADFYEDEERKHSVSIKRNPSLSSYSLEDLETQMEEVKKLKPKLYFTDPRNILKLFRDLEVQNLKFMLHTLEFKARIQEESGLINLLQNFSDIELRNIRWKVQRTEASISNIEQQTKNLEERCRKLLEQEYKEFISGNESILMHAYIAETFSYLMGTEPNESTTKNLALLGAEYKKLKFQADGVPTELLQSILTSVTNAHKERKIKAKIAVRKLTDFDILINRTLKLLDKPEIIKRRKLMTRSPVTSKPKPKPPPLPPISEEEQLQLYLFTDVCRPQHPISFEIEKDEEQFH